MIEGTRSYRGKNQPQEKDSCEAKANLACSFPTPSATESPMETQPNAVNQNAENMDRRAWFSALVPALGDGLVKLLRESNHLREELDIAKKFTR